MNGFYFHNGTMVVNGEQIAAALAVENGKIASLGGANVRGLPEWDLHGGILVPGFLDVHTHGAVGVDVNAASAKDLERLSGFFARQGVTGWLASILSDSEENTLRCIAQICGYMKTAASGARLLGIHLEGPFLAKEYKGAMPEQFLRLPDPALLRRYQAAAGGHVRYLTVSPELEGAADLAGTASEMGIAVALGHSGATYEATMECIRNGAAAATHTFNAMKLMHQHFPAIAGAVLESDVWCEAICDGRHLHPAVVRLLLKTKGHDRVVAVTDSIMATGLPDGQYRLGANEVTVADGDARLADGTRAGSTLTAAAALKNLTSFTGEAPERVLPLLTENPARLLSLSESKGSLAVGKDADLTVLTRALEVAASFVGGAPAFSAAS